MDWLNRETKYDGAILLTDGQCTEKLKGVSTPLLWVLTQSPHPTLEIGPKKIILNP